MHEKMEKRGHPWCICRRLSTMYVANFAWFLCSFGPSSRPPPVEGWERLHDAVGVN